MKFGRTYADALVMFLDEDVILRHNVSSEFNAAFKAAQKSFQWHYNLDGQHCSWRMQFSDTATFENYKNAYAQALYEDIHKVEWESLEVRNHIVR